jgi:hypothetical protein
MSRPSEPWRRREALADLYYMDARARVLDLAAFLDRLDRAEGAEDHRLRSLRSALGLLADGKEDRARRILESWSDPTPDPVPAAGSKGATGAWPGA